MEKLIHRHLIITALPKKPPMTEKAGEEWLRELVDLVNMQILMDAKAIYCEDLGNEGVTGVVGLKTSHSSFHSWHEEETPFVSFDLYSCHDFSLEVVFDHLNKWETTHCNYLLIDRDPACMVILDQGVRQIG